MPSIVNIASGSANNAHSATTTGINVTAGNLVVVATSNFDTSGNPSDAVVDSLGHTFTKIGQSTMLNSRYVALWSYPNHPGGTGVTFTYNLVATASDFPRIAAVEISGAATTTPLDQSGFAQASTVSSINSPSLTTTQASEILIAVVADSNNPVNTDTVSDGGAATSGWTKDVDLSNSGAALNLVVAHATATSTGAYVAHAVPNSGAPTMMVGLATFKASTGADTTPPTFASASVPSAGTSVAVVLTETGSPPILPASGVTGFSVLVNGTAATISSATASSTTVTLNLASTVFSGDTVTVSYTPGNVTDSAASPNAMVAFSAQSVTNSSTQTGSGTAPTLAPTVTAVSAGDGMATVQATVVDSTHNGSNTITSYTATASIGGVVQALTGTISKTGGWSNGESVWIPVTGLTNGTAYTFTVHATNVIGNSSESIASASVTPAASSTDWTHNGYNAQRTNAGPTSPIFPLQFAWAFNGPDTKAGNTGHLYTPPRHSRFVVGGNYVFVSTGSSGLYCLNKADGSIAWQYDGEVVNASPVYDPASGKVLVGTADGNLVAITAAQTPSPINAVTIAGRYWCGGPIRHAPLVAGGSVYALAEKFPGNGVGGTFHKVTISGMTLDASWPTGGYTISGAVPATPAAYSASRACLVFGCSDLTIHCVLASNGTNKWAAVNPSGQAAGTSAPSGNAYTFEGGWPVIADQHGYVFIWQSGPAVGNHSGGVGLYPNTNTDTRTWLVANPAQRCLFVLSLDTGTEPFVPAVGSLTAEGIKGTSNLEMHPSHLPVVRVLPATDPTNPGGEVVYIKFRNGQAATDANTAHGNTNVDYRWDGHMGEMVLDDAQISGYAPGDLRFVQFANYKEYYPEYTGTNGTSECYIEDETSPLYLAGDTLIYNHWASVDSARLGTRTASVGSGYSNPILTTANTRIMPECTPSGTLDNAAAHYSKQTRVYPINTDLRNLAGPAYFHYLNVQAPPFPDTVGAYSTGQRPYTTIVTADHLYVMGHGGEILAFYHSFSTTATTAITHTGPPTGQPNVVSTPFTVKASPYPSTPSSTITVTMSDGGAGGTFYRYDGSTLLASNQLTLDSPDGQALYTYKPAVGATGAITLTATPSGGGISTPQSVTYTVSGSSGTVVSGGRLSRALPRGR